MKGKVTVRAVTAVCTIASLAGVAGRADAQSFDPRLDVAERPQPLYDPVGIPLAAFRVFPSINLDGSATDNLRATNNNPDADAFLVVRPEVQLRSGWARHSLNLRSFIEQRLHFDNTSDDTTSFGASGQSVYDASRSFRITTDFSAGRFSESRSDLSSFRGSRQPVDHDVLLASATLAYDFPIVTTKFATRVEYRNFHDVESGQQLTIDQDFRDVRIVEVLGSANYNSRSGLGVVASFSYDRRSYVRPSVIDRDSTGFSARGGVSLELSQLLFGTIQSGYFSRRYDDPRFRDFSGIDVSADLLWNVTALTSVRLGASRRVEESGSTTIAGNTRTDVFVRANHELYRNVLISADMRFGHFTPNGPGSSGNEFVAGASARYLINRQYTVRASFRHSRRDSADSFLRYRASVVTLGLRFAW